MKRFTLTILTMSIVTLKKDKFSHVWRDEVWVYKRQHEFLHDNELHFYKLMEFSRFTLPCIEVSRDTLKLLYIKQNIVYPREMRGKLPQFAEPILADLKLAGIRHGDLTKYAILLDAIGNELRPFVIDFSESRLWNDPRKDKRPEGDRYWLRKTLRELSL